MNRPLACFTLLILTTMTQGPLSCRPRASKTTLCQSDAECPARAARCSLDGVCVECADTSHCDCHQRCLENVCTPLGATRSNQTLNAHGNWTGEPGDPNYAWRDACESAEDCGIGQICNPMTKGCILASLFSESCNPSAKNTCPNGPNGEALVCEPTSAKCLPGPTCLQTHNCCGHQDLICDTSANVCRTMANECAPPSDLLSSCPFLPREQDSCLPGYFCSEVGLCVQCTCDADCGSGESGALKCHLLSRTCKAASYCDTASDCDGPLQSCDTAANTCAPTCSVENERSDCELNFYCHPTDHVCRSRAELPCTNDDFYPNTTPDTARPLDLPAQDQTRTETDLSVCGEDADWFTLSLNRGDRLVITLSSPHPDMTASSKLLSPDGQTTLAQGVLNPGGSQLLEFTANRTNDYYLKIDPTGDSEGFYSISLTRSVGEVCQDPFEEDEEQTNDTPSTATTLYDGATSSAPGGCLLESSSSVLVRCSSDLLRLCLGDTDYYTLSITESRQVEFTLKDYSGDLTLEVFGPFEDKADFTPESLVGGSDLPAALVKKVCLVADGAGVYFTKVGRNTGSETPYTLQARIEDAAACE